MSSNRESIEAQAVAAFAKRFGTGPEVVASAPGRVNLIGEHVDYNDGLVLPAAIDRTTAVAASARDDGRLVLVTDAGQEASFAAGRLYPSERRAWTDYITGVAMLLQQQGMPARGASLLVASNVPRGSGLSSSAALELAAAFALEELFAARVPPVETALLCQRAEHEFAGVKCGIMDQFVSCLGRRDHALLLDCRSLAVDHVPLPAGADLLICDTGVRRALGSSEYNRRREECAEGLRLLAGAHGAPAALRDVSPDEFAERAPSLPPVVRRRCAHVVSEIARVERAAAALRGGNLPEFGKLMYDSHLSLQRDYEVSCPELDRLVDICAEAEGVYGARMTGAGFGGCVICLVRRECAESVTRRINAEYPARSGRRASVYACATDDGARSRRIPHT
ncbi:MAG TPA: galactokinase [Bacteroidota bacterium]|nr:galactokinase [Bacteroidota bacterium]